MAAASSPPSAHLPPTVGKVRPRRRRRSRGSPAANIVSAMAIGVAIFASWVVWRQVQPPQDNPPSDNAQQQIAASDPATPPSDAMPAEPPAAAIAVNDARPRPRPPRINRPPQESTAMPAGDSMTTKPAEPTPEPPPPPPDIEADLIAASVAMAASDFATAEEALAAADAAASDTPLATRVASWKQLLHYARGYTDLEAEALTTVTSGDEYDTAAGKIAIVECTDETFIFRSQGRTVRRTPTTIPSLVVDAIMQDWLDDRPANLLFVGAHQFTKPEPDLAAARQAWEKAAASGADASALLPLLDDPAAP